MAPSKGVNTLARYNLGVEEEREEEDGEEEEVDGEEEEVEFDTARCGLEQTRIET